MQAALFDLPTTPPPRAPRPVRRRRVRLEVVQLGMQLPGADASPRQDREGRDIERLVRLHHRALRRGSGATETRRALMARIRKLVASEALRRWRVAYQGSAVSADDAVQEALLWVHQQIDRYRGTTHRQGNSLMPAWIRMLVSQRLAEVAIAANHPVRLTRTDRARMKAEREAAEAEGREPPPGPTVVEVVEDLEAELSTPEMHALRAEEESEQEQDVDAMWRMVARLPTQQRRLVRRVHRDGLEVGEAAQREGLPVRRAWAIYRAALDALRDMALGC